MLFIGYELFLEMLKVASFNHMNIRCCVSTYTASLLAGRKVTHLEIFFHHDGIR